jgi:hypothetical protein
MFAAGWRWRTGRIFPPCARQTSRLLSCCLLAGLVVILLGPGCSRGGRYRVTGKLTSDGEPLQVGPQAVLLIVLYPLVDADEVPEASYPGSFNREDGSFEVRRLPPGRYRVGVTLEDPHPLPDRFQGAYGSHNSPLIIEVLGPDHFELDLVPSGTRRKP